MSQTKPKMVILADIASLRITCVGFQALVEEISKDFDVVACKFYSYVAKRNRDYNEYIANHAFDTFLPSASRRRNKLDSRQIISAVEIANSISANAVAVNAVGLITGEGDILPVLNLLKSKGIDVYDINTAEGKYKDMYNGFINVPVSALRVGYAAPAIRPGQKRPKPAPAAPAAAAHHNQRIDDVKNILAKYKK
ncbi:MAG: NYN domain-containing protein [Christensenellaceae bacterium]|jgi:hypothetical protein|nr:NYN domain-containing protein [Christensenellaceae bacterium]